MDRTVLDDPVWEGIARAVLHAHDQLHIHSPLVRLSTSMNGFDDNHAGRADPRERHADLKVNRILFAGKRGLANLSRKKLIGQGFAPPMMLEA